MFGIGAVAEVRYSPNLRLLDRLGTLGHALDDLYANVAVTAQDHLELVVDTGESPSRVDSDTAVFFQSSNEEPHAFLARVRASWELIRSILEMNEMTRLGVRGPFLVGFESVEQAVDQFKREFFDYYVGLLEGLGKPIEVQTMVRFAGWQTWFGVPFELAVRIMPIHVLPELQKVLQETKYSGALLMDLDRYAEGPLPTEGVGDLVEAAFSGGIGAAREIGRRLVGSQERRTVESA